MSDKVNLADKLSRFSEHWSPKIVARSEAHLLLIEPAGTPNTGDPETAATKGSN